MAFCVFSQSVRNSVDLLSKRDSYVEPQGGRAKIDGNFIPMRRKKHTKDLQFELSSEEQRRLQINFNSSNDNKDSASKSLD